MQQDPFPPKQSRLLDDYQPRARRQRDSEPARGTVTRVCGRVHRDKAKLSTMLLAPVMEFPVFNPIADTSLPDCILGNGKPQSCDHQSVSSLHARLQLTSKNATPLEAMRRVMRLIPVLCRSSFVHDSVFDDQLNCIFQLTCCHIPLQASVSRRLLRVALNNSPLAICLCCDCWATLYKFEVHFSFFFYLEGIKNPSQGSLCIFHAVYRLWGFTLWEMPSRRLLLIAIWNFIRSIFRPN